VLLGAGGAAAAIVAGGLLVEEDVLPGRSQAYRALGLNGDGAPMPDAPPGTLVTGSFRSQARGGAQTGWALSYPVGSPTDARLPVWLVLHGGSGDELTPFDTLGLDRFRTLAMQDGLEPFAIAAAYGGPTGWRPRTDGTDSSRMLIEEFVPMLERRGLDVGTLALGGWSMGGYGALRLAGLGSLPVRAAAVLSPALASPADDGADPDRLDVTGHPERLEGVPLRIDCGRGDPFYPVVHDFVDDLDPAPESSFGAGGHTPDYWRSVAPQQVAFVGAHLA
jgi:hypothetical protein